MKINILNMSRLVLLLLFLLNIIQSHLVGQVQVTVGIMESSGGCGLVTNCEDSTICFDITTTVSQDKMLDSYNIWMTYDNTILSRAILAPNDNSGLGDHSCVINDGIQDTDSESDEGAWRISGVSGAPVSMTAGVPVIIHTICFKVLDVSALGGSMVCAGGDQFVGTIKSTATFFDATFDNNISLSCTTLDADIIACPPDCATLFIKAFLEGPYDGVSGLMRTDLNGDYLLPGQDLGLNTNPIAEILGEATAAGQPYNKTPWNYNGTEGDNYGDITLNPEAIMYDSTVVDWVLVSVRAGDSLESSDIWKCSGLLHRDGIVEFPDGCGCLQPIANEKYYIIVEHRNHLPIMSNVTYISNDTLSYDFTSADSWKIFFGTGQKELVSGVWAMLAGNGSSSNRVDEKDINSNDFTNWQAQNGSLFIYQSGDHNMNTDTNTDDFTKWQSNNGKLTFIHFF